MIADIHVPCLLQALFEHEMLVRTILTPLEYSYIGLDEDAAIVKYGAASINIYQASYQPLDWIVRGRAAYCCAKLICNKDDGERVVGLHVLGPNSGEVIQGTPKQRAFELTHF